VAELRPCPYCLPGTEKKYPPELRKIHAEWGWGLRVTCSKCLATGPPAYSDRVGARLPKEEQEARMKEYAINGWNTRAERTCTAVYTTIMQGERMRVQGFVCSLCDEHLSDWHKHCSKCGARITSWEGGDHHDQ